MILVKITAIFSVFIIAQMTPVSLPSSAEYLRVPKHIKPGTNITILGKNNNYATFNATFSGDHMDKHDECNIFFTPDKARNQFIIKLNNQNETEETTYDIDPNNGEVSFALHVISYSSGRVTDYGDIIMYLHFEQIDRGQEPIGHCKFTSFKSLEYIVFKGVEHVKTLSFNFSRPDY